MELLQTLLNLLFPGKGAQLEPLLRYAAENEFDLKRMLGNLDVSALAPLLGGLFTSPSAPKADDTAKKAMAPSEPVARIADRDIVNCLNSYLSSGD